MRPALLASLTALGLLACGSDPPPRVEPPDAPDDNDPAFTITELRDWYLIGNDLTPGGDTLEARVVGPADFVDAWIDGGPGVRLEARDGGFELSADIGDLGPGEHEVLFAADGATTAFARLTPRRSHPLYVLVSTDWDPSEPSQSALDYQDTLHAEHPGMRITHFIGPYTFTDPDITDTREAELVDWLKTQRDDFDDEIGLHIHPWCHFVEYAGLVCNTSESTVYTNDTTGYTIECAAYGDTDFRTLLEAADELFMERGLGKPVTFRAGGWTATIETLRALAATGYVADTSANNWARMDEWNRPMRGTLYAWNMEHWAPIGDTSQPYYPNMDDVLSADDPALSILEVPDNAIMVDYVTVEEMIEIFDANWDGDALEQPVSYMMGFHPSPTLGAEDRLRADGLLDHTDQFLAVDGAGPVVYTVLRDMPTVWKP